MKWRGWPREGEREGWEGKEAEVKIRRRKDRKRGRKRQLKREKGGRASRSEDKREQRKNNEEYEKKWKKNTRKVKNMKRNKNNNSKKNKTTHQRNTSGSLINNQHLFTNTPFYYGRPGFPTKYTLLSAANSCTPPPPRHARSTEPQRHLTEQSAGGKHKGQRQIKADKKKGKHIGRRCQGQGFSASDVSERAPSPN